MQILFLGAPGAGKGTQCKRLSKHLDLVHLGSGDLLRQAVKAGTAAGHAAKPYIDKGNLVPDGILIDMFREKLRQPDCNKGFILDGFPRNLAQAKSLDQLLEEMNRELTVVVNVQVDDKLLTERITGRRICSNKECNEPYHVKFATSRVDGVCDICGHNLTRRSDDKEELVSARLKAYNEETAPLIEYYDERLLLRTIDGDGDPDEIFADILRTVSA